MATKKKVGILQSEAKLNKKYGGGLASSICLTEEDTLKLPSRILALNHQLGGGIPYGHIMELFGEENAGKTLLAMDFGTVAQSCGGVVLWADAEGTFNGPWAEKNGLSLSKVDLLPTENSTEVISDWLVDKIVYWRSKLVKNEPILLIVDSIAALECLENLNSSQVDAKAEMGNRAKAMDTMLRRRNHIFHKYGVCAIFINQLRSKIGASQFEDPDSTPGGKAMRFYASIRYGVYGGKMIKNKKDKRIGRLVYGRLKKTKVAIPEDNIQLEVYYREHDGNLGYSKYHYFTDLLVSMGVVKRKSARYYLGEEKIAYGDSAMIEALKKNKELRVKLISASGIMTISKLKSKLSKTPKNLYPVKVKSTDEDEDE